MFGFEKLDVYRCADEFVQLAAPLANRAPRGYSSLADQLRAAAPSIALNIAEGSGKTGKDVVRYYEIARGSALECAAILNVFLALGAVTREQLAKPRALLDRVVAMLTVMIQGSRKNVRPPPRR